MRNFLKALSFFCLLFSSLAVYAVSLSGGLTHTIMIGEDSRLYTSGLNNKYQLGHTFQESGFHVVDWLPTVTFADATADTTVAVTNGKVYVFGDVYSTSTSKFTSLETTGVVQAVFMSRDVLMLTNSGDVYLYKFKSRTTTKMPLSNIVKIDAGSAAAIALDSDGKVFTWGANQYGQLGHGDFTDIAQPTLVEDLPRIQEVSMAPYHVVVLDYNGNAYTFGYGDQGRLGHGNVDNLPKAKFVSVLSDVVKVVAGSTQTLYLKSNGKVLASGNSYYYDATRAIYGVTLEPAEVIEAEGSTDIFAGEGNQIIFKKGSSLKALGNSRNKMLALVESNDLPVIHTLIGMNVPASALPAAAPEIVQAPVITEDSACIAVADSAYTAKEAFEQYQITVSVLVSTKQKLSGLEAWKKSEYNRVNREFAPNLRSTERAKVNAEFRRLKAEGETAIVSLEVQEAELLAIIKEAFSKL